MSWDESCTEEIIENKLSKIGWQNLEYADTDTGYVKKERLSDGREADYVLYVDGTPVGVIEAKKEEKTPENHIQQAKNYANIIGSSRNVDIYYTYATNGKKIFVDSLINGSPNRRELRTYHSPEDFRRRIYKRDISGGIEWLKDNKPRSTDKKLWDNQVEAMESVKKSLISGKNKILVTMATGSGKTRLSMALTYQLLESKFADRVLFLPDTRDLADDAKDKFKSYDPVGCPKMSDKYVIKDWDEYRGDGNADIVTTTIQKVFSELDGQDNYGNCTPGEFDIIFADECHRGMYDSNKGLDKVLDFYDVVDIGLTATPAKRTIDRYNGNRVYDYTYKEALEAGNVVRYHPFRVKTKFTMDGIEYDGETYKPSDIGNDIIVQDIHNKAFDVLKENADLEDDLTLVFANSAYHANKIAEHFTYKAENELDVKNPHNFVKTILSEDRHAEQVLEDFRDKRDDPKIAVTVKKVSTGVDVRQLKNVVFLRPVGSKIMYNQMVGRGTRSTPDKSFFRIFDFVGLMEHHSGTPFDDTSDIEVYTGTRNGRNTPVELKMCVSERNNPCYKLDEVEPKRSINWVLSENNPSDCNPTLHLKSGRRYRIIIDDMSYPIGIYDSNGVPLLSMLDKGILQQKAEINCEHNKNILSFNATDEFIEKADYYRCESSNLECSGKIREFEKSKQPIINVEDSERSDEILDMYQGYPIKEDGEIELVKEEEYIEKVSNIIIDNQKDIRTRIQEKRFAEVTDEIEDYLKDQFIMYNFDVIANATDKYSNIYDFYYKSITGDGDMQKVADYAYNKTIEDLDIDDEDKKWWVRKMKEQSNYRCRPVEIRDLKSIPFSHRGGLRGIIEDFELEGVKEVKELIRNFELKFLDYHN